MARPSEAHPGGKKQPLPAAGLHALRDEHSRTIELAYALAPDTLTLERTLSDLGKQTCAVTPAEIELMERDRQILAVDTPARLCHDHVMLGETQELVLPHPQSSVLVSAQGAGSLWVARGKKPVAVVPMSDGDHCAPGMETER